MASLTKKSTSPFFFACFRDHTGRQCRRSTFETNPKLAQKVADMYEGIARRKINAKRIRKTVQELCRELGGDELPSANVNEYCLSWLKQKEREVAQGSMELYQKSVQKFLRFLGPRASCDLADIHKKDIVAWRNSIDLSPATINGDLKVAKMIFSSARKDDLIEVNPTEFVAFVKNGSDESTRRPFTLAEIGRVLEAAGPEWRSLVLFGIYTGQRLGDLAGLTWANVDLQRNELNIVTRKRKKRVVVPMAVPLREHILSLPSSDDTNAPLHPKAYHLLIRDHRVRTLSGEFGDLLAAAGLRAKLPHVACKNGRGGRREPMELSFHSLRHTACSLLREAGVSEAVTMQLIGHDSVEVSRNYTHVGTDALSRAVDTLPRL
jgi:integrase